MDSRRSRQSSVVPRFTAGRGPNQHTVQRALNLVYFSNAYLLVGSWPGRWMG